METHEIHKNCYYNSDKGIVQVLDYNSVRITLLQQETKKVGGALINVIEKLRPINLDPYYLMKLGFNFDFGHILGIKMRIEGKDQYLSTNIHPIKLRFDDVKLEENFVMHTLQKFHYDLTGKYLVFIR